MQHRGRSRFRGLKIRSISEQVYLYPACRWQSRNPRDGLSRASTELTCGNWVSCSFNISPALSPFSLALCRVCIAIHESCGVRILFMSLFADERDPHADKWLWGPRCRACFWQIALVVMGDARRERKWENRRENEWRLAVGELVR